MRKRIAVFLIFLLFAGLLGTVPAGAEELDEVDVKVDATPVSIVSMQAFTVRVELENKSDEEKTVTLGGDSNYVPVENKTVTLAGGEKRIVYLYGTSYYPGAHSFRVTMKVENGENGEVTPVGSEILVSVADLPPEQEPPTFPQLSVSGVKFIPETPSISEPFDIQLEITNKGTAKADNVSVYFDGGDNFEVLDLVGRKDLGTIHSSTRTTVTFRIRAKKTRVSNTATVRITYRHEQAEQTVTETLNLPLAAEDPEPDKKPRVKSVSFVPSTPNVKEPFQVSIQFVNESNVDARNFTVTLEGGNNFEVLDLTNRSYIGTIGAKGTAVATFRIVAKDGRESNAVTVRATYSLAGSEETITENLNLPLGRVEQKEPEESPYLKLGTFSVTPDNDKGDFTLNFQLQNLGKGAAKRVSVRLDSSQAFPTESSNVMYVGQLDAGSYTEFTVKMRVAEKDRSVYNIPVAITCTGEDGAEFSAQESITFSAALLGLKEEPVGEVGTPRVMLGKYTLSQSQVLAGDTVTLTLYIENNSPREVRNIKISLGVIQISGETGGTVFSPVNSSNSFYVERIPARQTYMHSVDLYVDPNAAAKTYIVPVDINYEDKDGKSYQVDELVNIPVTQESRLQVLSVEVPPVAMMGQPISVAAEFVNVGKVALKNFLVSIEGDFHKENATYFLPSLEIGASDYFMGMIFPQTEGLLEGTVVFSYTDHTNKEVRIEKPFEVMVQPMVEPEFPGEFPEPGFPGEKPPLAERVKQNLKWLIPAALVLAVAIVLFVRKRRAARGEMFDESV